MPNQPAATVGRGGGYQPYPLGLHSFLDHLYT